MKHVSNKISNPILAATKAAKEISAIKSMSKKEFNEVKKIILFHIINMQNNLKNRVFEKLNNSRDKMWCEMDKFRFDQIANEIKHMK